MEFINKIRAATEEIFASMILLKLRTPAEVIAEKQELGCHVSAMIGLSGDFNAMLGMHCPAAVGMAISGSMLGIDVDQVDDDTRDALGEIANMLAGGLKEAFAAENINLLLALPNTISGDSYKISAPSGSNRILIPFDIDAGRFYIDLRYSPS